TMVGLEDTDFLLKHILAWMVARNSPRSDHVEAHGKLAAALKKLGKRDATPIAACACGLGSPQFAGNCSFLSGAIFPPAGLGKFRPYGVRAARAAARHG